MEFGCPATMALLSAAEHNALLLKNRLEAGISDTLLSPTHVNQRASPPKGLTQGGAEM